VDLSQRAAVEASQETGCGLSPLTFHQKSRNPKEAEDFCSGSLASEFAFP